MVIMSVERHTFVLVYMSPTSRVAKAADMCELIEQMCHDHLELPIHLFGDSKMTNAGWSPDIERVHKPASQKATEHERQIVENFEKFNFHQIGHTSNESGKYLDVIFFSKPDKLIVTRA